MPTVSSVTAPVTLFYSYAHEDEPLRDELQGHLKIMERRGLVAPWHDRRIVPGEAWDARLDEHLRAADLVLLLVSTDFIASDYIMGRELTLAMQRHDAGEATVVPIVVRAVDLDPEDGDALPFLRLQGLPTDLRPVTSWPNRDEAWTNVAKGLRVTVKTIQSRRPPPAPVPPLSAGRRGARDVPAPSGPPDAGTVRHAPAPSPADPAADPDPVLDRVVSGFAEVVHEANRARGAVALDEAEIRREGLRLIDLPDQRRVLWVDDRPANNRLEAAALAKLQIEVVTARSTAEAQERLTTDPEPFDLVISDWDRRGEPRDAGLILGRWLRDAHPGMPLVFYHGEFDPARRADRARQARVAGALGEAILPGELMALVLRAFGV